MVNVIETLFPRLHAGNYQVTSPETDVYNCIAWAAGVTSKWWWPQGDPITTFWPAGVDKQETVAAFQAAFASLGYVPCDSPEPEPGFEKIALFCDQQQFPMHAARQLHSGAWTSKLGTLEDVEHVLTDLEGTEYGAVVLLMKRASLP